MTLALLVPRNYRHRAVLVRFINGINPFSPAGIGFEHMGPERDRRDPAVTASIRSFCEEGGEMLRLRREDQTPRLGAPRR